MAVQAVASPPSGSAAIGLDRRNPSEKRKAVQWTLGALKNLRATTVDRVYDVMLSFRGKDTRNGFVDHIYNRLVAAAFSVFKDDRSLLGQQIGPGLSRTIENSKIAIPIISKNYAGSKSCLGELRQMMECRAERGQVVLPVLYDVEVSDVRDQTGEFGKAFRELAKHHTPEQVEEWKEALRSVGRIGGWSSRKVAGDGRLVDMVVEKVSSILSPPWMEQIPMFGKKSKNSKYEVFPISSPAITKTFASHLTYHLEHENISVFRDDDQHLIGKNVDLEVCNAMDRCKIFIPILSEDFASSPDCLDKLLQMFKCIEKNGQKILPVFFGVDLLQKKELQHLYWTDMLGHDVLQETRQQWLESLDWVCSVAGFVSENIGNGNGGELAEVVVQQVNEFMRTGSWRSWSTTIDSEKI